MNMTNREITRKKNDVKKKKEIKFTGYINIKK